MITEETRRKQSEAKTRKPIVIEGIEHFRCKHCNELKPRSEFFKTKDTPVGIVTRCKPCTYLTKNRQYHIEYKREWNRAHRLKFPEKVRERERIASAKRTKDSLKIKARSALNNAVKVGKVIRPDVCGSCGEITKVTAHHDDYTKPLDVRWLCYRCHAALHPQSTLLQKQLP